MQIKRVEKASDITTPMLCHISDPLYHSLGYAESGYLSSSYLKTVGKGPHYYRDMIKNPGKTTKAMDLGTLVHAYFLEPDQFKRNFVIEPKFDKRTKAGKELAKAFQDEHKGKTIYSLSDHEILKNLDEVFPDFLWDILANTHNEIGCFVDMDFGKAKCKFDAIDLHENIFDVKKTSRFDYFKNDIYKYGYHFQAAFYREMAYKYFGEWLDFYWIVIETCAPYRVNWYQCGDTILDQGRDALNQAIEMFINFQENGLSFGVLEVPEIL